MPPARTNWESPAVKWTAFTFAGRSVMVFRTASVAASRISMLRERATAARRPLAEYAAAVTGGTLADAATLGVVRDCRIDTSCCGPGAPAAIHFFRVLSSAAGRA